jgi:hypothetical protein
VQDKIDISRDGCLALFSAFAGHPDIPQITMPRRAVVLRLGRPGCDGYTAIKTRAKQSAAAPVNVRESRERMQHVTWMRTPIC